MVDVKYFVNERKENKIINSLEVIRNELKKVTFPLRRTLNPRGRERNSLINRVAMLTAEVEEMITSVNQKKSVELIKAYTNRIKEIMDEKEIISERLNELKEWE